MHTSNAWKNNLILELRIDQKEKRKYKEIKKYYIIFKCKKLSYFTFVEILKMEINSFYNTYHFIGILRRVLKT